MKFMWSLILVLTGVATHGAHFQHDVLKRLYNEIRDIENEQVITAAQAAVDVQLWVSPMKHIGVRHITEVFAEMSQKMLKDLDLTCRTIVLYGSMSYILENQDTPAVGGLISTTNSFLKKDPLVAFESGEDESDDSHEIQIEIYQEVVMDPLLQFKSNIASVHPEVRAFDDVLEEIKDAVNHEDLQEVALKDLVSALAQKVSPEVNQMTCPEIEPQLFKQNVDALLKNMVDAINTLDVDLEEDRLKELKNLLKDLYIPTKLGFLEEISSTDTEVALKCSINKNSFLLFGKVMETEVGISAAEQMVDKVVPEVLGTVDAPDNMLMSGLSCDEFTEIVIETFERLIDKHELDPCSRTKLRILIAYVNFLPIEMYSMPAPRSSSTLATRLTVRDQLKDIDLDDDDIEIKALEKLFERMLRGEDDSDERGDSDESGGSSENEELKILDKLQEENKDNEEDLRSRLILLVQDVRRDLEEDLSDLPPEQQAEISNLFPTQNGLSPSLKVVARDTVAVLRLVPVAVFNRAVMDMKKAVAGLKPSSLDNIIRSMMLAWDSSLENLYLPDGLQKVATDLCLQMTFDLDPICELTPNEADLVSSTADRIRPSLSMTLDYLREMLEQYELQTLEPLVRGQPVDEDLKDLDKLFHVSTTTEFTLEVVDKIVSENPSPTTTTTTATTEATTRAAAVTTGSTRAASTTTSTSSTTGTSAATGSTTTTVTTTYTGATSTTSGVNPTTTATNLAWLLKRISHGLGGGKSRDGSGQKDGSKENGKSSGDDKKSKDKGSSEKGKSAGSASSVGSNEVNSISSVTTTTAATTPSATTVISTGAGVTTSVTTSTSKTSDTATSTTATTDSSTITSGSTTTSASSVSDTTTGSSPTTGSSTTTAPRQTGSTTQASSTPVTSPSTPSSTTPVSELRKWIWRQLRDKLSMASASNHGSGWRRDESDGSSQTGDSSAGGNSGNTGSDENASSGESTGSNQANSTSPKTTTATAAATTTTTLDGSTGASVTKMTTPSTNNSETSGSNTTAGSSTIVGGTTTSLAGSSDNTTASSSTTTTPLPTNSTTKAPATQTSNSATSTSTPASSTTPVSDLRRWIWRQLGDRLSMARTSNHGSGWRRDESDGSSETSSGESSGSSQAAESSRTSSKTTTAAATNTTTVGPTSAFVTNMTSPRTNTSETSGSNTTAVTGSNTTLAGSSTTLGVSNDNATSGPTTPTTGSSTTTSPSQGNSTSGASTTQPGSSSGMPSSTPPTSTTLGVRQADFYRWIWRDLRNKLSAASTRGH